MGMSLATGTIPAEGLRRLRGGCSDLRRNAATAALPWLKVPFSAKIPQVGTTPE
jgi:hypothetical protein